MSSPEQTEVRHKSSGLTLAVWVLVVLAICYPLSVGPVARLYRNRPAPAIIPAIYAPLGYLYGHSAAAKAAFDWYAGLWGVDL